MKLLVVRHGVAMERADFQLESRLTKKLSGDDASDDLRPLTLDGLRKMKKSARGLGLLVDRPQVLVSSPLTRARQTAETLQDAWKGLSIAVSEALRPSTKPQATATALNHLIDSMHADQLIAIVGHEPHVTNFASWLLTGSGAHVLDLKKGGACLLEFDGRLAKASAHLKWLALPSMLRSL